MSWNPDTGSLRIHALRSLYQSGQLRPRQLIEAIYRRIESAGDDRVWITKVPMMEALSCAKALESADKTLPLYGIPFAVKDNIDVEGLPTTAACPAFSYVASRSAVVVETLRAAGAILIGKTNMDQFATGLVGVRSPYGVPRNPFDERYIPGGSSSGSAVAVSSGLVSFSLGTDTAGSGRVPAGFNNLVGWKPTPGTVSTVGVVPACRSLDCVSVFSLTCDDAITVANVLRHESCNADDHVWKDSAGSFRFGVPTPSGLEFFGDSESRALFDQAIDSLRVLGGTPVEVDITPFREVARLLYEGPWIAERTAALKSFLAENADALFPVTRAILEGGRKYSAVDAFEGLYRLEELKRSLRPMWKGIDFLLVPTTPTTYTIEEVEADPVGKNSNLGYYTNFVNLLGYSALAVPTGFSSNGLPFGVTLIGPSRDDDVLLLHGGRLHRSLGLPLGATHETTPARSLVLQGQTVIAVVGAHLRGMPLNWQLTENDATFLKVCQTAPQYRLYALPGSIPPKPALVRVAEGGSAIELELWQMPLERFGYFVDLIPPPLGIGSILLDGGDIVKGFVCESVAIAHADDISTFGGWRSYLEVDQPDHKSSVVLDG
jgi:allophanate hydrolase